MEPTALRAAYCIQILNGAGACGHARDGQSLGTVENVQGAEPVAVEAIATIMLVGDHA